MAKDKEKSIARILYVEQGKSGKQIAEMLNIGEKTISAWVNKGNWKSSRNAKVSNKEQRLENIYAIIDQLAADRIALSHNIVDVQGSTDEDVPTRVSTLRKEIYQIDIAIANWNKTLQHLKKDNEINQLVFIQVMEIIFRHFDFMHPEFMSKSLLFQEHMLNSIIPTYAKE